MRPPALAPLLLTVATATPTLILQGREDERVAKPQGDEPYAALRFKKVRWHRMDALTRLLGRFERYLGPR